MDLQATLNSATRIIQQAGAMARDYFERPHTIENKTSVFMSSPKPIKPLKRRRKAL